MKNDNNEQSDMQNQSENDGTLLRNEELKLPEGKPLPSQKFGIYISIIGICCFIIPLIYINNMRYPVPEIIVIGIGMLFLALFLIAWAGYLGGKTANIRNINQLNLYLHALKLDAKTIINNHKKFGESPASVSIQFLELSKKLDKKHGEKELAKQCVQKSIELREIISSKDQT